MEKVGMKPNIEEFKLLLAEDFGRDLTPTAESAAEDFHKNYDDILLCMNTGRIQIVSSTFRLYEATGNVKAGRYHIYGSFSTLSAIAGLVTIFFNLKIGIGLLILSFVLRIVGKVVKNRVSQTFSKELMELFKHNQHLGMRKICANYLAGIIQLRGPLGHAHLPLNPSTCITGIETYAKPKETKKI